VHPLALVLTGLLLSETLGLFLCAALIYLASSIERGARSTTCFLFGGVAVALPLTSPALLILSGLAGLCILAIKVRQRNLPSIMATLAGVAVFLVPWETHCVRSSGSLCLLLFARNTHGAAINANADDALTFPVLAVFAGIVAARLLYRGSGPSGRLFAWAAAAIVAVSFGAAGVEMGCMTSVGPFCKALHIDQPLSVAQRAGPADALYHWFRTWSIGERDMHVLFDEDPRTAPDRAFASREQREALLQIPPGDLQNRALLETGKRAEQEHPAWQKIGLPLTRAFDLWFDMRQNSHAQMEFVGRFQPSVLIADYHEFGAARTFARIGKAVLSSAVYVLYVSYPLLLLVAFGHALWTRNIAALLICTSVLAYTLICGYSAFVEARRNVVFLPAILFLLALLAPRDGANKGAD
jgi:hypothetical protein